MIIEKDFFMLIVIVCFLFYFINYYRLKNKYFKQNEYFIKTLEHDFKVSVIAQIRALEILLTSENVSAEKFSLISDVKKSCKYTLDMISMLADSYKAEIGENIFVYEIFDTNEIIKSAITDYKELFKEKNINITSRGNKLLFCTDKMFFEKVIKLILSASINYSKQNSSIDLTLSRNGNSINVSVSYKGKILSEEETARMLSRSTIYSTVGHGIQMFFCKKFAEMQKGKFVFYSKNGINTFLLSIPEYNTNGSLSACCYSLKQLKNVFTGL